MKLRTALRLGRVSNLPTVWTNALAAAVLAEEPAAGSWAGQVALAALARSLFYVGGMWLNDAFDAEIDTKERKDHPIPQGEVSRRLVLAVGFALLVIGVLLAAPLGRGAVIAGLGLAVAIVTYDVVHKRTLSAPLLMGLTPFFAYALGAAAVSAFAGAAIWGALGLFAYVVGLTYAAKQEAYDRLDRVWPLAVLAAPLAYAFWRTTGAPEAAAFLLALLGAAAWALRLLFRRAKGDVPRAVVALIAGIALYDATLIASTGALGLALLAAASFLLTLALQRIAPGT